MKRSGATVLAEMLAAYDTTHVFMVPAVLRRTMAELERHTNIRVIHTHGEKAAAYMADGYARVSGKPGVCMAQQVGALNLAAGIRDAHLANSPVIAMTGGSRPDQRGRGVYQEADDLPAFTPYTKFNAAVEDVSRFPDVVEQAYRIATSGCPGPVHIQFQGQEGEIEHRSVKDRLFRKNNICQYLPTGPYQTAATFTRCCSTSRHPRNQSLLPEAASCIQEQKRCCGSLQSVFGCQL